MAEKAVKVTLTASVDGYVSGMGRAADATQRTERAAESAGRKIAASLGRGVVSSVKAGAAAFTTVTTAVAATGVAAIKAGAAYNGMQQASRAALTTILGGAEKANAQMDKLDEFARNSPFAKQVFIGAQQQLLGFGLEAKKVIPALDAIQNSVAAVGGSNEDISNVTDALAKMMGSGKLAGDTLNRLGLYGIDAAGIIGKSMGKTGAEVRDMASKPGGIPVDKVWDPLIKGLDQRFGGAAANVKQTWVGATDRIKGAWRDIGSDLAAPFVNPKGGGMAIEWVNKFADLMRAAQKQVGPLVDVLMPRLAGTFDKITPALERATAAVKGFDMRSLNDQMAKLSGYAPLIAGVSTSLFALGTGSLPVLKNLGLTINPVVAGLGALVAASPELRTALKFVWEALKPLEPAFKGIASLLAGTVMSSISQVARFIETSVVPVVASFVTALTSTDGPLAALDSGLRLLPSALSLVLSAAGPVLDVVRMLLDGFGALPGPVQQGIAVFGALRLAVGPLKDVFNPITTALRGFGDQMKVQAQLAQMEGRKIGGAGSLIATGITRGTGMAKAALSGIVSIFNPWTLAITGATVLVTGWMQAQENARRAAQELAATIDEQTGQFTKQTEELLRRKAATEFAAEDYLRIKDAAEKAGVGISTLIGSLMESTDATEASRAKLEAWIKQQKLLAQRGGAGALPIDLLSAYGSTFDGLARDTEGARREQEAFGDSLPGVASNVDNMAAAAKKAADAQRELADASLAVRSANMDADAAAVTYAATLQKTRDEAGKLTGATNKQKTAFDLSKQAGRDASTMLQGLARDAMASAKADLVKGDSVADVTKKIMGKGGARDAFIEAATKMGLSEKAAKRMADQYGLTKGDVDKLRKSIDELPREKEVRLRAEVEGAMSGIERLRKKLASLKDKTITVTQRENIVKSFGAGTTGVIAKAAGGPIVGPGTGTSDSILARLSNGEHVLTAAEVQAAGGHAAILRMRKSLLDGSAPRFANGGAVGYAAGGAVLTGRDRSAIEALIRALTNPIRDLATATKAIASAQSAVAKAQRDPAIAAAQRATKAHKAAVDRRDDLKARAVQLKKAADATKGVTSADRAYKRIQQQIADANVLVTKTSKAKTAANEKAKAATDRLKDAQSRLKDAQKALADQQRAIAETAERVSDQFRGQVDGPGSNVSAWIDRLKTGATDVAEFTKQVEALRKAGLNETLVQQVIGMGARGGSRVATEVLGDKSSIGKLNSASSALQSAADKLGLIAATGVGRYATGGAIYGAGGPTSDMVPALLSSGEHVMTAAEVAALGGQSQAYALREMIRAGWKPQRFATGGAPFGHLAQLRPAPMGGGAGFDYARLAAELAKHRGGDVTFQAYGLDADEAVGRAMRQYQRSLVVRP